MASLRLKLYWTDISRVNVAKNLFLQHPTLRDITKVMDADDAIILQTQHHQENDNSINNDVNNNSFQESAEVDDTIDEPHNHETNNDDSAIVPNDMQNTESNDDISDSTTTDDDHDTQNVEPQNTENVHTHESVHFRYQNIRPPTPPLYQHLAQQLARQNQMAQASLNKSISMPDLTNHTRATYEILPPRAAKIASRRELAKYYNSQLDGNLTLPSSLEPTPTTSPTKDEFLSVNEKCTSITSEEWDYSYLDLDILNESEMPALCNLDDSFIVGSTDNHPPLAQLQIQEDFDNYLQRRIDDSWPYFSNVDWPLVQLYIDETLPLEREDVIHH